MLERPVVLWLHLRRFECAECHHRPWEKSETFGEHVKWTERLYTHVRQEYLRGCPCRALARRYGLSERTVFRWTFEKSRGGRPRKLGRVRAYFTFWVLEPGQPLRQRPARNCQRLHGQRRQRE